MWVLERASTLASTLAFGRARRRGEATTGNRSPGGTTSSQENFFTKALTASFSFPKEDDQARNKMAEHSKAGDDEEHGWLKSVNHKDIQAQQMMPIAQAGQFDPEVMARDVKILYKRLSMMDKWLLSPRSRFMQVRR